METLQSFRCKITEGRTDVIPMGHPNGEFLHWDKDLLLSGQRKVEAGKELKDADYSKNEAKWKPVFGSPPEQLLPGDVFKALKPLFFSDKLKIGHNVKFDLKSIAKYYRGVVPSKPYFDTMMASFIIVVVFMNLLVGIMSNTLNNVTEAEEESTY